MSVSQRIKQARSLKGMSQRAVAARVDLSATAISKYERGLMKPGSDVLLKLAGALDVRIDYFLRPQRVGTIEPAYRKRAAMGKKAQRQLVEKVRDWLERYIEIEELSTASGVHFALPDGFPWAVQSLEDVENAAEALRRVWAIGRDPIENLTQLLEDRGIKIGLEEAADSFDACAFEATIDGGVPVIVVREGVPGDRQRFNLAHELGHLVLDVADALDEEKAANRFAAAFLAPRAGIETDLGAHRHTLSPRELHLLKHKYGMSMQALVYRAKDLRILSDRQAAALFKMFRARGWYRNEPGDPVASEAPQRFELMVLRALSEDVISKRRAAELLGRAVDLDATEEAVPA